MLLLLYGFWLILNGRITLEICLFGIPICVAVFLFMEKNLDYSLKKEKKLYRLLPLLIQYVVILLIEIIKANLQVLGVVVKGTKKIEPVRVSFKTPLTRKFTKVLLANSITLTPGTITASVEEDEYLVHCLSREFAKGISDSVFVQHLMKIEKVINS